MKAEDSLSFFFFSLLAFTISLYTFMLLHQLLSNYGDEKFEACNETSNTNNCRVFGGAVSCNVYCMTDSRADGFGVSLCILSSLEDARVSPEKKVQAIVVKSNFNPVRNYEELMLSIPQHHGSVKLIGLKIIQAFMKGYKQD